MRHFNFDDNILNERLIHNTLPDINKTADNISGEISDTLYRINLTGDQPNKKLMHVINKLQALGFGKILDHVEVQNNNNNFGLFLYGLNKKKLFLNVINYEDPIPRIMALGDVPSDIHYVSYYNYKMLDGDNAYKFALRTFELNERLITNVAKTVNKSADDITKKVADDVLNKILFNPTDEDYITAASIIKTVQKTLQFGRKMKLEKKLTDVQQAYNVYILCVIMSTLLIKGKPQSRSYVIDKTNYLWTDQEALNNMYPQHLYQENLYRNSLFFGSILYRLLQLGYDKDLYNQYTKYRETYVSLYDYQNKLDYTKYDRLYNDMAAALKMDAVKEKCKQAIAGKSAAIAQDISAKSVYSTEFKPLIAYLDLLCKGKYSVQQLDAKNFLKECGDAKLIYTRYRAGSIFAYEIKDLDKWSGYKITVNVGKTPSYFLVSCYKTVYILYDLQFKDKAVIDLVHKFYPLYEKINHCDLQFDFVGGAAYNKKYPHKIFVNYDGKILQEHARYGDKFDKNLFTATELKAINVIKKRYALIDEMRAMTRNPFRATVGSKGCVKDWLHRHIGFQKIGLKPADLDPVKLIKKIK